MNRYLKHGRQRVWQAGMLAGRQFGSRGSINVSKETRLFHVRELLNVSFSRSGMWEGRGGLMTFTFTEKPSKGTLAYLCLICLINIVWLPARLIMCFSLSSLD